MAQRKDSKKLGASTLDGGAEAENGSRVRLNIEVTDDVNRRMEATAEKLNLGSRAQVVRHSVALLDIAVRGKDEGKDLFLIDQKNGSINKIIFDESKSESDQIPVIITARTSRKLAAAYANVMITSVEEMLQDASKRFHNRPLEEERLEAEQDVVELLNQILVQLRGIERILTDSKSKRDVPEREKIEVAKHMNKFLDGFAGVTGRGTGVLFIAAGASLLTYLGVQNDIVSSLLSKIK